MKVLVTGARGFVGSALVRQLVAAGRPVLAGMQSAPAAPPGCPYLVLGNLANLADHRSALAGVGCIVHAAARVHVMDDCEKDPLEAFRAVNVTGTLSLARQAVEAGVKRFVFVSSIKVNGEKTMPGAPFVSTQLPDPQDSYGISKLEAERALLELGSRTGLELVIVRPPLVYGPRVKANFRALMALLKRELPLPFGAIRNSRSLVGLDNLVDLLAHCIDHPAAPGNTFLVSDDDDVSTTGLIQKLAAALEVRPRLIRVPVSVLVGLGGLVGQSEKVRRLCEDLSVDISHTKETLGWRPPVTLEKGLRATARDFLNETTG